MAWPILPSPTMPSVRPRSSRPVNWARFHSPRRIEASAGGHPAGDAVQERQRVLGGGDRVAGRSVDDDDAGPGRGLEVDVVDADPGPPDDDQPRPGGDQSASTWTWLRTMSAS